MFRMFKFGFYEHESARERQGGLHLRLTLLTSLLPVLIAERMDVCRSLQPRVVD